jgi:type I restriction enzyme S subunit
MKGLAGCPVTTKPGASAPNSWSWVALPDVAKLESGHTPSRRVPAYWEGGDVPWLSLKDIRGLSGKYVTETVDRPTALGIENSSARILPKGTVALCRTASVGNVAILGRDMATSQDFVNWVCSTKLLPEYLYWAFRGSAPTFELEKQGSTHQTIYMPVVERFRLLLPPVSEQERIVDVLDEAEALRAKRRAALAQLDTLTQCIFLDLFGDPKSNLKRYPEIAMGEIFSAKPIFGTMIPPVAGGGEWVSLRVANIQDWRLDLSDEKHVSLPREAVERHSVRDGDLLMARAIASQEHLGKAVIAYPGERKWAFDSHLMRLRFKQERVLPEFVRHLLMTPGGRQLFLRASRRSAVQFNINTKEIAALRIPLPPLKLQESFVRHTRAVEELRSCQCRSRTELDALFASLQHRAFRGEL